MDPIKQAFSKVKQDIAELKQELNKLKQELKQITTQQTQNQEKIYLKPPQNQENSPTHNTQQTDKQTHNSNNPTHIPTYNYPSQALKTLNLPISTGNRGVPTDKQTNRQTDRHIQNPTHNQEITKSQQSNDFEQARQALDSLDNIKKGIRRKFKRLTQQEMLVFSTLYSFEEQGQTDITYKILANHLNLSESSIRDYINRLINKGIPIIKTKQNNKQIILSISQDLKNIASLSTISKLRDL
ncbi:MAG: helix-turn-helix domain-containing protein [Candidatus Nanoarchaeia archaeon]